MSTSPPLFQAYPTLRDTLAHQSLGSFPTPLTQLQAIGRRVGSPSLWCKRDDLSAEDYGGNKVRKLEWILAHATQQSAKRLFTVGCLGSHHVLATAIHSAQLNLPLEALQFPSPLSNSVRLHVRATENQGLAIHWAPSRWVLPLSLGWHRLRLQFRRRRNRGYYIAGGGSSPHGALGYVNAAFELKAQIEEGLMPEPQHIFLAAGTGGTAAGLLLGCHLAGIRARIVAVRVVDSLVCNRRRILQQCKEAWQLLKKAGVPASAGTLDSNRLHLEDAHLGDGFGHPTVASTKAVALVAALEGLPLETVYTGKAFSAMLATLIDSAAARQETSLFWNTCSAAPMEALTRQNANAPARSIRPPGYDEALNVERDSR